MTRNRPTFIFCIIGSVISCVLISSAFNGCAEALEINTKTTHDPIVIQNGTKGEAVLDCDYELSKDDYELNERSPGSLVVKWFFNNNPLPVYQWIHSKKPQESGVLKGKLNLDYKATQDNNTMYRALMILNPTTELSGEYKCTVFTFDVEKSQTRRMIVYVPEKSLEVTQTKLNEDKSVNITCKAEGVFPEPELVIYSEDRSREHKTHLQTFPRNGVFDAVASLVIDDSELKNSDTRFDCELKIPETNYSNFKSLTYTPGNSAHCSRTIVTWFLPLVLLLCLRL